MSTIDHILAAAGELRTAWGWLVESTIPGRTRRTTRPLSDKARSSRDVEAREDRQHRLDQLRNGRIPGVAHSAAANLNAVDARTRVVTDVEHAAWNMRFRMAADGYAADYQPDGRTTDTRFTSAINWISDNAHRLQSPTTINETYRTLHDANTYARARAGEGTARRPLAAECPACGRRSLYWDTSSTDTREWHVGCSTMQCRCGGRDCPCKLPDRVAGMTHLWLEAGWARFADQLNGKEITR